MKWTDCVVPDWPAPARVHAFVTTRAGGVSQGPYASMNCAAHVGDDPRAVAENRVRLSRLLPREPVWLTQVHGRTVVSLSAPVSAPPVADAAVTASPALPLAVLTADCLPVVLSDRAGTVVGVAHAGWRGLAAGVLEATVQAMGVVPSRVIAWLGPAIGPRAFEVGEEVRTAFFAVDPGAGEDFRPGAPGKWHADLYGLARRRLEAAGVVAVYGGGLCTYSDPSRFFSYRRDGATGRMASVVWLG